LKLKNVYILWTTYFDSTLSRREGRRLPSKLCIPEPALEELVKACKDRGLEVVTTKETRYPRVWWKRAAYVAVGKEGKKTSLLVEVSKDLRRIRSMRG
jgi:signal recognition particle subunit SRP19